MNNTRERVTLWFDDLWFSVTWYARHGVWSVPTRRWSPEGNFRWPIPMWMWKR